MKKSTIPNAIIFIRHSKMKIPKNTTLSVSIIARTSTSFIKKAEIMSPQLIIVTANITIPNPFKIKD